MSKKNRERKYGSAESKAGTELTKFYWVIGAHVIATAYHHWVRRDDTLQRMI